MMSIFARVLLYAKTFWLARSEVWRGFVGHWFELFRVGGRVYQENAVTPFSSDEQLKLRSSTGSIDECSKMFRVVHSLLG